MVILKNLFEKVDFEKIYKQTSTLSMKKYTAYTELNRAVILANGKFLFSLCPLLILKKRFRISAEEHNLI